MQELDQNKRNNGYDFCKFLLKKQASPVLERTPKKLRLNQLQNQPTQWQSPQQDGSNNNDKILQEIQRSIGMNSRNYSRQRGCSVSICPKREDGQQLQQQINLISKNESMSIGNPKKEDSSSRRNTGDDKYRWGGGAIKPKQILNIDRLAKEARIRRLLSDLRDSWFKNGKLSAKQARISFLITTLLTQSEEDYSPCAVEVIPMLDDWKMFLSTIYHLLFCTDSSITSILESDNTSDADENQIFSRIQQYDNHSNQPTQNNIVDPSLNNNNNINKFDDQGLQQEIHSRKASQNLITASQPNKLSPLIFNEHSKFLEPLKSRYLTPGKRIPSSNTPILGEILRVGFMSEPRQDTETSPTKQYTQLGNSIGLSSIPKKQQQQFDTKINSELVQILSARLKQSFASHEELNAQHNDAQEQLKQFQERSNKLKKNLELVGLERDTLISQLMISKNHRKNAKDSCFSQQGQDLRSHQNQQKGVSNEQLNVLAGSKQDFSCEKPSNTYIKRQFHQPEGKSPKKKKRCLESGFQSQRSSINLEEQYDSQGQESCKFKRNESFKGKDRYQKEHQDDGNERGQRDQIEDDEYESLKEQLNTEDFNGQEYEEEEDRDLGKEDQLKKKQQGSGRTRRKQIKIKSIHSRNNISNTNNSSGQYCQTDNSQLTSIQVNNSIKVNSSNNKNQSLNDKGDYVNSENYPNNERNINKQSGQVKDDNNKYLSNNSNNRTHSLDDVAARDKFLQFIKITNKH